MNREEWLEKAIELLDDGVLANYDVPKIQVAVGFPSHRAVATKNRVIGQCWNKRASDDGETFHILVSPLLKSGIEVLGVLVHEMGHAVLPFGVGHKAPFKRFMDEVGLVGKPTATTVGDELRSILESLPLPDYPHVPLNAKGMELERKKQSTRMLKVMCMNDHCGCIVRMTQKWLDAAGEPTCGCGCEMELVI